ncbi:MAG: hypothetical protein IPL78_14245 [Chloroflexi bacterium]|nr:hypothetical protein [Chloroflexota bacterium]
MGIIFGLAGLTKVSAFTLSLTHGLGLAWLWLSGRRTLGQTVPFGLAFTLGILVVSGWWLGHNWLTQDHPLASTPMIKHPGLSPPATAWIPFGIAGRKSGAPIG